MYQCVVSCSCSELWCGQSRGCINVLSLVAVVWTEWRVYQCVVSCSCSELWCGQSRGCINVLSLVAVVWTEWRVYQFVVSCSCSELWCGQSGGCISVWNLDSTKGSLQRLQHPLPKDQAKSTTCDVVFIVTCPQDSSSVWSYIYPGESSSSFPVMFPDSAGFTCSPNCFPQSGTVQSIPGVNTLQTKVSYLDKICLVLSSSVASHKYVQYFFRIDSQPLLAHYLPKIGRALCRITLLPVTHGLVDIWMLTVKPVYNF